MIVKGNRLLVEQLPFNDQSVLKLNDDGRRINEGKIIGVGEEVTDMDYGLGVEIIYIPLMTQEIRNTDPQQVIVDVANVVAIK